MGSGPGCATCDHPASYHGANGVEGCLGAGPPQDNGAVGRCECPAYVLPADVHPGDAARVEVLHVPEDSIIVLRNVPTEPAMDGWSFMDSLADTLRDCLSHDKFVVVALTGEDTEVLVDGARGALLDSVLAKISGAVRLTLHEPGRPNLAVVDSVTEPTPAEGHPIGHPDELR